MGGLTFKPELAEAVMAGEKTETRRVANDNPRSPWWRERCGFSIGRDYAVQPGRGKIQIGRARILYTSRGPLRKLTASQAAAEGFASVADFEAIWEQLHGSYDSALEVWVVSFEALLRYTVIEPSRHGTKVVHRHQARDLDHLRELLDQLGSRCVVLENADGKRLSLEEVAAA
jgi:hypothetical protein